MNSPESQAVPLDRPLVCSEDGTLSLHFGSSAVQSEMRCEAPDELIVPYTRTMMGFLLFKPRPARIAMVGLGGGSLAKYCYARLPEASMVVAEINPYVVALRQVFRIPSDDGRFRVVGADGASFVRNELRGFDVLLVDGFDARGQSPQLCTQEFYDDCRQSVGSEGLVVVNLLPEDPYLGRSLARLRRTFETTVCVESQDYANRVVFASSSALNPPLDVLCARLESLERIHRLDLRDTLARVRLEQFTSQQAAHLQRQTHSPAAGCQ